MKLNAIAGLCAAGTLAQPGWRARSEAVLGCIRAGTEAGIGAAGGTVGGWGWAQRRLELRWQLLMQQRMVPAISGKIVDEGLFGPASPQ